MPRSGAALGSLLFLIAAPGTVAGLVPWLLGGWRFLPSPLLLRVGGGALLTGGSWLLLECFARFALEGRGTPAPTAPTTRLVVSGPYRRVRNPMYVAVTALILGQAALFCDLRLLGYATVVWAACHLFVLLYEEPSLQRAFPKDYAAFFAAVPRWIPRLTPWRGPCRPASS